MKGDHYLIRSLYFDSCDDGCMADNDAGVDDREKYRVRIYDLSPKPMHLEIKEKLRGYCRKVSCDMELDTLKCYEQGMLPLLSSDAKPAMHRFWIAAATRMLRPRAVIQYERCAYVYPVGNVRITFDRNIAVSDEVFGLLEPHIRMHPVFPTGMHLLEVKYDEILPEHIQQALELGNLQQTTFSKYYYGRLVLGH